MKTDISLTNVSFDLLSNSSEFLNIVLNSINSCVLLLDKELKVIAYNNAMKTIFSNNKDEDLLYMACGEAIGCAYQVEEAKDCGSTSKCCSCELRESALISYLENKPIYKEHVIRPYFTYEGKKVDKHLQFSTRIFTYNNEKYVIILIEDISKWYKKS